MGGLGNPACFPNDDYYCITVPITEPIAVYDVPNLTYEAAELCDCLPNRYLQDIYGFRKLKTAQK